jgi:hypothetical protein
MEVIKRPTAVAGLIGITLIWILSPAFSMGNESSGFASRNANATCSQSDSASSEAGSEDLQSAQNKALDSTATQWSFQLAYQAMPDYHQDTLDNGQTRAAGSTDYLQIRIVAPVPLKKVTLLPRLTLRHYQNAQGESGLGNTELFALVIPRSFDWGAGRFGVGPLVTLPGSEKVARNEWGYGIAAGIVNGSGRWFYGALVTQSWRGIDPTALPPGTSDTNPLGIAPFLNFQLGGGWYLGNGDMVMLYDWNSKKVYLPLGIRVGKVIVRAKGTWNLYGEYQTSVIYGGWRGPAVKNSYRFNLTYTIPVG